MALQALLEKPGDALMYEYDFGDTGCTGSCSKSRWRLALARCFAASPERAGPPEDCGGADGYGRLLKALSDPSHPEHDEMAEWIGDDFDPEQFEMAEINEVLAAMGRATVSRQTGSKHGRRR